MNTTKLETGETLDFDEAAHVYTIDGKICPGTHSLMERFGIVKPMTPFTAPYAERGSRIHLITQYHDENDLDEASVDSTDMGYLNAWKLFLHHHPTGFIKGIEQLIGSANYWYATKVDRIIHGDGKVVLVNLKTGQSYPKPHAIQAHLEAILHPEASLLWTVRLTPTGEYEIDDYSNDDEARKTATAIAQANGMAHHYMTTRKKREKVKVCFPSLKPGVGEGQLRSSPA